MRQIGPPEIILILLVLVLLFGAKKLPELARGSGRALRIFKAETKGLVDDDDDDTKTPEQRQIDAQANAPRADVPRPDVRVEQPTLQQQPHDNER
ncbi:MAG: sec-independent protein translocase protein TatA [Nocardioidaceae bacterium]|jgi:sec-independent protein translocase protein TatA|nr:sec-independent protein translocase protein TatA [Nocardioidaceae bacterium]